MKYACQLTCLWAQSKLQKHDRKGRLVHLCSHTSKRGAKKWVGTEVQRHTLKIAD
jgi:hypothetical protein